MGHFYTVRLGLLSLALLLTTPAFALNLCSQLFFTSTSRPSLVQESVGLVVHSENGQVRVEVFSLDDHKIRYILLNGSSKVGEYLKLESPIVDGVVKLRQSVVVDNLGRELPPETDIARLVKKYKVQLGLSDEVRKQAQELLERPPSFFRDPLLENLTDIPFFSVDKKGAIDRDDVIFAKKIEGEEAKYNLLIAIPHLAYFIPLGTPLFKSIFEKGQSLYLPWAQNLNMLPTSLTHELFSLNPNKVRVSFVMDMNIDIKTGQVTSFKLRQSIVKSKRAWSYDEFSERFRTRPGKLMPAEKAAIQLYQNLLKVDDVKKRFNIEDSDLESEKYIQQMIKLFMLMGNSALADWSFNENIEGVLYRGHAKNHFSQNSPVPSYLKKRNILFSDQPDENNHLVLGRYTQFTSPMRRGLDFWNQSVYYKYLDPNSENLIDTLFREAGDFYKFVDDFNETHIRTVEFLEELNWLHHVRRLPDLEGQELWAQVVSNDGQYIKVILGPYQIPGYFSLDKSSPYSTRQAKSGKKVKIRIDSVDLVAGKVWIDIL